MKNLNIEQKYAFRERMNVLYKENIRDFGVLCSEDETEIKNGIQMILPENAGEVLTTAIKDLKTFLLKSMSVETAPLSNQKIEFLIDENQAEDYIITVGKDIAVSGKSERGLAQGIYCIEDKMTLKRAPFLPKGEMKHTFMFSPRMVHSGYGLDKYPDEHLSAIAHQGFDAILIFAKGVNTTPCGYVDFNDLIKRAAKYGIDVYAYSYMKSEMSPEADGAEEYYDSLYGNLFRECKGLKGITLVGESVGFPSRDPHVSKNMATRSEDGIPYSKPRPGWWPCEDYPQWLELVKKSVRKVNPQADIVFWTYNWGYVEEEYRIKLIESLPTDISLLVTYEMFQNYKLGSIKQTVADYSLAFAGPGNYFLSEAKAAKKRGIRLYAMTNTAGLTWDIGVIPYEPMPHQWMERYKGIREAYEKYGLCGLMESHHYGLYPSFISELAKNCFIAEKGDFKANLLEILEKRYGAENIDTVNKALELWSEAIRWYTPTDADQYGAFRCGPSYPLCLIKETKPLSDPDGYFGNKIYEVIYPADYSPTNPLPCGRGMLPNLRINSELEALYKMNSLLEEGLEILKEIQNPNQELQYLTNLGEYICCCVVTGIHAKEWFKVTSKMQSSTEIEEVRRLIPLAKELIEKEKENAQRAIPLVERDSRLGWEPSMGYAGDKERIEWKLRYLDYVRDFEIKCYENASDDKWIV